MTVLGPKGLRDRLKCSDSFLGQMNHLRALEFTHKDANLKEQKFGILDMDKLVFKWIK